jgi:glucose-1-phosphate thymidylyltransferase
MRGIILAGGTGSRLWPITKVISKQLLPVYDKPMIYYPLSLLMAAGVRDFSVITTPRDVEVFKSLLGDGSQWGISIEIHIQVEPLGLPDAFRVLPKSYLLEGSILILGDNLFYGSQIARKVREMCSKKGASIFGYMVSDVSSFGSFTLNDTRQIESIAEKKNQGKGFAIPGIYKFDEFVSDHVSELKPSKRGELEITDLLETYHAHGLLSYELLDRGTAWLDTGTVENLNQACELVRVIQARQGMLVGSPEEVSYRYSWISESDFTELIKTYGQSEYAKGLLSVLGNA